MQRELGPMGYIFIGIIVLLILGEMTWSRLKKNSSYDNRDTVTNIIFFVGFQISKFFIAGFQLWFLTLIANHALLNIPKNAFTFAISFLVSDFIYYWMHRISHTNKWLWGFHAVHHSSERLNLTTAYRLHWLSGLVTPFFYAPLILIGFPIAFVAASIGLNLLFQFFLHTRMIGKIKFLEGVIDTPSAHRVHHGKDEIYIDKNFGGVLMIWDRIFNTYQPEIHEPSYGLSDGFVSYNPFKIMIHGFRKIFITNAKTLSKEDSTSKLSASTISKKKDS